MDTKLKNNKQGKAFGILLCIIIIAFISACAVASYSLVFKNTERYMEQEDANKDLRVKEEEDYLKALFIEELYQANYALTMSSKQQLLDMDIEPSQVFLTEDMLRNYTDRYYDEKDEFVDSFNDSIVNCHRNFYYNTLEELPDFQYYFIDNNTDSTMTNSIEPLSLFLGNTKEAQSIKDSYPFYIVFEFQEDGSLKILDYKGLEQEYIDKYKLIELNKSVIQEDFNNTIWFQYKDKIKSPSNASIVYASKSEEFYKYDNIRFYISDPISTFSESGFIFIFAIAIILLFLLAMFLPFKKSWHIGEGLSSKIPFEINMFGLITAMGFYNLIIQAAWEMVQGYFICEPESTIMPEALLNILDYSINFALWFFVLSVVFITLLSMRQIFTLGLKRYFKEKTLTGRIILWTYRKIKQFLNGLGDIDLSDPSNKAIFKILAVNFVILLVMCSIWVFGIFLLVIYSIILYFVIRKYYDDVRKKYTILLDGTKKIAEGSLDYTVDEDLGVFEPLKNELTKVQHGFRKAVEEETKSQRMKTELITNVSHDLKTPLTAIITYVDLLKNEDISVEERRSYIDTLDMKSQRLKTLIEDLFEVSKASSNNVTLNFVDVDLIDLIKQVMLELDDKISKSNVQFRLNNPENKIILSLDSEKTYRVFENLITNIIKYSMPNTRAYIDITREEELIEITLKNVSASELNFSTEEITERFVRGDQSRNAEGSGLGLAIAKSFVELQGGKFRIEVDGDLFKVIIHWRNNR